MRFTNAFLASLLFFGVMSLAIDKQRDEYALTTNSNPFATTSFAALITPDAAGIGDITDSTHDALKIRAPTSRDGRRRKTTGFLKTETKTTGNPTIRKSDPKTNKKPEPKTEGKSDVTCTGGQKKSGKCPDEKKNKNWEVLYPTKGCRPRNCKTCGKAIDAKGGKKSGKKIIRDLSSLRSLPLSKRTATFEPGSKTEAGLMAWTKDVWSSSPKVLHIAEDSFKPTSFFIKWTSLGQGTNFVTVKSLMGCKLCKGTR